jgi:ABC-2 type transport system permease protein
MNKTFLVLKNEIITTFRRPSFLFSAFGIPLIAGLIFAVITRLNQNSSTQAIITQVLSTPQSALGEGYVDQSSIIKSIPASVPEGSLIAYPDEASAMQAITNGEISAYYVLPADYLETGKITYLRPDFNPLASSDRSDLFEWVVQVNLLGGDIDLATLINGPKQLEQVSLAPEPQRDQNSPMTFFLPYGVTIIFYIVILSAASLLLSSVTKEKENRVLEILMLSVTPQQLLSGKIIGLGLIGLLQTAAWVGTGRAILAASGKTFSLPAVFQLPPSFLVWALVFFLLGYIVYASLMAGLGALVPNLREASQATIAVIFPLIIPMFLINLLIEAPHGLPSVIMSLFPLTAPVAMMARLSAGGVPLWQPILAAILLALTDAFVLRAVAGMFRAQALLSGQQFSIKLYYNALLGKA